jgi:hypothetical protein
VDEDDPEFLGCRRPAEAARDVLAALCMGDPFLGKLSILFIFRSLGFALGALIHAVEVRSFLWLPWACA